MQASGQLHTLTNILLRFTKQETGHYLELGWEFWRERARELSWPKKTKIRAVRLYCSHCNCLHHPSFFVTDKTTRYGISDKDLQLYQSYLGNRHCRTAIYNDSKNSNKVSNWAKVRHGVPQGSVLGPLPDFGRMFLKLKYTDITQNTLLQ